MSPEDYVEMAVRTEAHPTYDTLARVVENIRGLHAGMGMETEVGEFMDELKAHIFYNKPLDETNLEEELGDLMWYVALACDAYGLSLSSIMAKNIAKLQARYPEKFTELQALNRDLDRERETLEGHLPERPER